MGSARSFLLAVSGLTATFLAADKTLYAQERLISGRGGVVWAPHVARKQPDCAIARTEASARVMSEGVAPCGLLTFEPRSEASCKSGSAGGPGCPLQDSVRTSISALGRYGAPLLLARDKVLAILGASNTCSAWLRESDPDPAGIFATLTFALGVRDQGFIINLIHDPHGDALQEPYVASTMQGGGRNSKVTLNREGAFFRSAAIVMREPAEGGWSHPLRVRELRVGPYRGDSSEAQMTTLLHELAHVVGRIPADGIENREKSTENTREVLRFCRSEIEARARHQQ